MKNIKKNKKELIINSDEATIISEDYINEINTNTKYSLDVDPLNIYNMLEEQKNFIKFYIEYKDVKLASVLANIDENKAIDYLSAYSSQQEIRRIYKALMHRRFASKIISLDKIGAYLSTFLTDEFIPEGEKLNSKDKLKCVNLLLDYYKLKSEFITNPKEILTEKDLEEDIKSLSIDTIKSLLNTKNENDNKNSIVDKISKDNKLSIEEEAYLKTLSFKELSDLLESIKKEGDNIE